MPPGANAWLGGSMSVKQLANGEWCFRFDHGGVTFRGWHYKSKTEAQVAEGNKKAEVARKGSAHNFSNDIKLMDLASMFFEQHSRPHKRNWKQDGFYINSIKQFFGSRRVKDIGPLDVDRFREWIRDTQSAKQRPSKNSS
jgi:hypothetical protein